MWQMIPQQNVILADGGSDMEVISFDDSEQFEEDSVYSWGSENNQMYNWSIWKASLPQTQQRGDDKELGVRMVGIFLWIKPLDIYSDIYLREKGYNGNIL